MKLWSLTSNLVKGPVQCFQQNHNRPHNTPPKKQEEKCLILTMLASCTPPHTSCFCPRACTTICFLNHVNDNKEKHSWTAIFACSLRNLSNTVSCSASKEAFPSLTCGVALVPLSWAVSAVALNAPRMETPPQPSQGPVPRLLPAPREDVLPHIQLELPGLQSGTAAPCSIACRCQESFGSDLSVTEQTLQTPRNLKGGKHPKHFLY